ncbi:hypothetical protein DSO57_1019625 [Entomophthora muscae]|uniref:Uncharacterized protein n=1 Tax=Entomophthora muscae TaxID=34485 RepID=A0ACC2SSU7_9FUNG|nr:hypothetical protein DSO57_1019625 [Entomophthora muscae]
MTIQLENEDEDEDKVYRAPRIAPMPFDDRPLSSKKERDEMRQKEKAARSRLMKDLVNDFDDRPEEHRVIGSFHETEDSELADRKRYEEENFVRLQPSKKAERKVREMQKGLLQNELLTLDDFRGVSSINDMDDRSGNTGILDRALGRTRNNEHADEQQTKQMKRAMKSTGYLFSNVITEAGQSKSGSLFKKAKSNFKNKQRKHK